MGDFQNARQTKKMPNIAWQGAKKCFQYKYGVYNIIIDRNNLGVDLLNLKKFKKILVANLNGCQILFFSNMAVGCLIASIIVFFCGMVSHGIFLAVVSNSIMNLAKLKKP